MITHTHSHTHQTDGEIMTLVFSFPYDLAAVVPPLPQIKARGEGEKDAGMDSGDEGVGGGLLTCVELEEVGRRR